MNRDAPTISIIADRNAPQRYEWVDKIGRTTGWTYAQVQHTCIDTKHPVATNIRLRCQDLTDVRAAKGDSGAPVFLWGSNGVTLLGIVWGAMEYEGVMYTTISALGNIWNDLAGSGPVYR